jgi:hypothetical protein
MFFDLNLPVDPADTSAVTPSRNLRESLATAMYNGALVSRPRMLSRLLGSRLTVRSVWGGTEYEAVALTHTVEGRISERDVRKPPAANPICRTTKRALLLRWSSQ